MNKPIIALDPKMTARPRESSLWDLLALELANEWRGMDTDDEGSSGPHASFSPPWAACAAPCRSAA